MVRICCLAYWVMTCRGTWAYNKLSSTAIILLLFYSPPNLCLFLIFVNIIIPFIACGTKLRANLDSSISLISNLFPSAFFSKISYANLMFPFTAVIVVQATTISHLNCNGLLASFPLWSLYTYSSFSIQQSHRLFTKQIWSCKAQVKIILMAHC